MCSKNSGVGAHAQISELGKASNFFKKLCLESTAILSGGFQQRESINLTCYCYCVIKCVIFLLKKQTTNAMICNE